MASLASPVDGMKIEWWVLHSECMQECGVLSEDCVVC